MGFRTEELYGEGYCAANEVIAHEIFALENTDILSTLIETILKDTPMAKTLQHLIDFMDGNVQDNYLINLFEEMQDCETNDCVECISYVDKILNAIFEVTGKKVNEVLWLCDTIQDVINEYECESIDLKLNNFFEYSDSDIVLSDLGSAGKLYGYDEIPDFIREITRDEFENKKDLLQ